MQIVAGLNLQNLKPRVWDEASPYYLPQLRAVMVSYAEFHGHPRRRARAMREGLRSYFDIPDHIAVYLDNGSFAFARKNVEVEPGDYDAFVAAARPDWWPVVRDHIPAPSMDDDEIRCCIRRTMLHNEQSTCDQTVPVIHICRLIDEYIELLLSDERLLRRKALALGGIVPNLLRSPKALPHPAILEALSRVRRTLSDHRIHLFGLGGTSTLHIAMLLGIDSVDSSGWRNRAARGIVQMPGRGDRSVADLGSWKGRKPSMDEWALLDRCRCPACRHFGLDGLRRSGVEGFSNRATHNLWTLFEEARLIEAHLQSGSYADWYSGHMQNSVYLPLVSTLVDKQVIGDGRQADQAGAG